MRTSLNAGSALRPTGIDVVGSAPWGTHFCQFYATREDLLETLVPYFAAGLAAGEFCMWVTSPPLGVEDAWAALARAVPDLGAHRENGRIVIIPHTEWYLAGGTFEKDRVLSGWVNALAAAQSRGCAGLRLSGDTFWLEKSDWRSFSEYEAGLDSVLGRYEMLALCTYSLERCGAAEIADVIKNHQFALLKRDGRWELIESFGRRRLQDVHAREIAWERERLAVTLESIGDAVIATDTGGRVVTLNGVAESMTGWSKEEAAGRPLKEVFRIVDEETRVPAEDPVARVLEAGGVVVLPRQTALIARDGSLRSIADSAAPIRSRSGQTVGVVLVFRDVTEARRAEAEVQRSLRRFELLAGTAGDLLQSREPQNQVNALCTRVMEHLDCHVFFNFLVDENAGCLHLNACAGIGEQEALRVEWLEYGAAVCGCVPESGQRVVAEQIPRFCDPRTDLVRSYGVRAFACHPLVGPRGQVLGTLSFGTRTRDAFADDELSLMKAVADQVAIAMVRLRDEQALRHSEEALREADRRKNEFLAMLSHELRNPLAPVRNSLYILDRAVPGGEQARRAQTVIRRQVEQLSRLVDDLLDVTRITRNKVELQRQPLELNELVRRAAEDQRSLFEKSGVGLEMALDEEPLPIDADPTRIAQVVGNLLQNAAKFTQRGGRTTLSVSRRGGQAVVRVKDDGLGMTPETIARLFQPFMQAHNGIDRGKGGLGLGLALVKGLVELHGGEVQAYSAGPGRGTEFTIGLPLSTPAGAPRTAERASAPARSRRVLIIEDNADAAESLREALLFGGHEVAVASSGPEGIARASEVRPDIVLCDIGLPGMDGYDVARALRASQAQRDVMLVALSGYAGPDDLRRAAEAGFDRHLAKPADLGKIEELLAV